MSVIYVETSALLKRAIPEAESPAVSRALEHHASAGDLVVSSALAWLEVVRSLRRQRFPDVPAGISLTMSGVENLPLDDAVLLRARYVGSNLLRSLDAIHLASAVIVGADSVMTYDDRFVEAVRSVGMTVLQP